jgi:hypothetical protein
VKRLPAIATIFALLLQATAWAAMVPLPEPVARDATAAELRHAAHVSATEPQPNVDNVDTVPCHQSRDVAHANEAVSVHETGDDACQSGCACVSFCAGVLGVGVQALIGRASTHVPTVELPRAQLAQQHDNPFRPPIANLS